MSEKNKQIEELEKLVAKKEDYFEKLEKLVANKGIYILELKEKIDKIKEILDNIETTYTKWMLDIKEK